MFGEVLYDCFPDGRDVLGGAPFNVAWHLQGFGLNPLMISRVGNDAHGKKVQDTMQEWGMDVAGLQQDAEHPTGQVTVSLTAGQPSYDIVTDQAYDHIQADAASDIANKNNPGLIYHGSLALRSEVSRNALETILKTSLQTSLEARVTPIFLDLNLRDPWWETRLVDKIIKRATWVKLNDEELCEVVGHSMASGNALKAYAKELFKQCRLERLIVTRGERGAFVVSREGVVEGAPVLVKNIIDTVGAGDAFSAVTIAGILQGWPIQATLDKALSFASTICQQRGATVLNHSLYKL
jgi:fructokinase